MEDTNVNPKCLVCRKYWKPDETDVKKSGLVYKTCKRCRDLSKAKNQKYYQKYRQENADKVKQQQQKYRQENADKLKQHNQKYYQDNAERLIQQRIKHYHDNKCEHNKGIGFCSICNPSLYLLKLQRVNLRRCLKIANLDKTKQTIEYLGCDVVCFKD